MGPESQSDGNPAKPLPTIKFKCVKCGEENEFQLNQKELLFGGADPVSGGARPLQTSSNVRTFIVRCSHCDNINRIRLGGGIS